MDFRVQPTRIIISGLSVLAATLMLNATARAASSPANPCELAGRDLKSLAVPADALTVDLVDHVPTDPAAIDEQSAVADPDPVAPILYLTPRVTNILRDVFGMSAADLPAETPEQTSSSPLADSDENSDAAEPAEAAPETNDLSRFQQQMFRTDI